MNKIIDFYSEGRIRNISYVPGKAATINEFYDSFIAPKLPDKEIVLQWHRLLVRYLFTDENSIFFIRKYESKKTKTGAWDTRRGAVIRFKNGINEIVYSSNFLAHDIFLMAYNGFCPTYDDFKNMVKDRKLRNTIGTESDRAIALYPGQNKVIKDCYLAHIAGVNCDEYRRNNNMYLRVTKKETAIMYPVGNISDWNNKERVKQLDYDLTQEHLEIVRAHTLRLLDPLNYFLTPKTTNHSHSIIDFKKNIGEYGPLLKYVIDEYKKRYGTEFEEFLELCRYNIPKVAGTSTINIEYDLKKIVTTPNLPDQKFSNGEKSSPNGIKEVTGKKNNTPKIIYLPDEKNLKKNLMKYGVAHITIKYCNGDVGEKNWCADRINEASSINSNIRSKQWYRKEKNFIDSITIEVADNI